LLGAFSDKPRQPVTQKRSLRRRQPVRSKASLLCDTPTGATEQSTSCDFTAPKSLNDPAWQHNIVVRAQRLPERPVGQFVELGTCWPRLAAPDPVIKDWPARRHTLRQHPAQGNDDDTILTTIRTSTGICRAQRRQPFTRRPGNRSPAHGPHHRDDHKRMECLRFLRWSRGALPCGRRV